MPRYLLAFALCFILVLPCRAVPPLAELRVEQTIVRGEHAYEAGREVEISFQLSEPADVAVEISRHLATIGGDAHGRPPGNVGHYYYVAHPIEGTVAPRAPAGWMASPETTDYRLEPGRFRRRQFRVTIPPTADDAEYELGGKALYRGHPVEEIHSHRVRVVRYRCCKEEVDPLVQLAFEAGFGHFLDQMIASGPRGVNTNMDMFAVHAAADLYMATDDPRLRDKALQAVKRSLFGYPDGELGVRHKVFPPGGHDGGVFDPSGFIMEGGQPDVFYGGESIYQLAGALAAVTDRRTGSVPPDWKFLEGVVRRCQQWRSYQYFYDPGVAPGETGPRAARFYTAGAGFSGRTSAGVPAGQASDFWKFATIADHFEDARHVIRNKGLPDVRRMSEDIQKRVDFLNAKLASVYEGPPPTWKGWSPWTKKTPYLPPKGWYSRLKKMLDEEDPASYPPVARTLVGGVRRVRAPELIQGPSPH